MCLLGNLVFHARKIAIGILYNLCEFLWHISYQPDRLLFQQLVKTNHKNRSKLRITDLLWWPVMRKECTVHSVTMPLHVSPETWWRHQMETFSALPALCVVSSPVIGEFPTQRPVTWSFEVFFDLRRNKLLNKQSWGLWFETPSCSLWRHCNGS